MSVSADAADKSELRRRIRAARFGRTGGLLDPPAEVAAARCAAVVGYAALPGEPSVDTALDTARQAGIPVFLPVTMPGHPLEFGRLSGPMAGLEPAGKWQIREPQRSHSAGEVVAGAAALGTAADDGSAELVVLVPGLAFDVDGYRLGNGAGFYDMTFGPHAELWERVPAAVRRHVHFYGVCWSDETGLAVPCEAWDLHVGEVLGVVPDDIAP